MLKLLCVTIIVALLLPSCLIRRESNLPILESHIPADYILVIQCPSAQLHSVWKAIYAFQPNSVNIHSQEKDVDIIIANVEYEDKLEDEMQAICQQLCASNGKIKASFVKK